MVPIHFLRPLMHAIALPSIFPPADLKYRISEPCSVWRISRA